MIADTCFLWVECNAVEFSKAIDNAYKEVTQWRNNFFPIPFGTAGKAFVSELARLLRAYAESSALESIAMKAVSVAHILLIQRPHTKSDKRQHIMSLPSNGFMERREDRGASV